MTGGQYSPTTPFGATTITSMYGHIEQAFSIAELAVTAGASFFARSTVYPAALADQLIEQAMMKPGFAVVEIISNCHMQYGRRNKIGNAVDMLNLFKEQAVTVKKAAKMEQEELQEKITIGVLADRDLLVSTDEYKKIREQARGGKFKAEVVISNNPIDYPKALGLDILLSINQTACDAYFFDLKNDGILVIDQGLVEQSPTTRVVALPFTRTAREEIGREMTANMVALGASRPPVGTVAPALLEKALLARIPAGTEEINLAAFRRGVEETEKIQLASLPASVISEEII